MDAQFIKLIELNVSGRVFALCQSRKVVDPAVISCYRDILLQNVMDGLNDEATPGEFNQRLEEQIAWLATEIDQVQPANSPPGCDEAMQETVSEDVETPTNPQQPRRKVSRKAAPYMPKAKTMEERLAEQRADMETRLEKDCVTLKLITPNQAKTFKRRLLGVDPQKAEEELVSELRNILHQQIRGFIRKYKGGPWANATLQHELRMDIAATRTLRSLTTLAKELLNEREQWLEKTKSSITGRLFGGKITLHK